MARKIYKPTDPVTPSMSNKTLGRLAKFRNNQLIGQKAAAELERRRRSQSTWIKQDFLKADDVDPRWKKSLFYSLKLLPAKQKGKRFEEISKSIIAAKGFKVGARNSSDNDFTVAGRGYELKGSTVTKGTDDVYSFLQIRPDQDYDYLVLTTFHFDNIITLYRIPKKDVIGLIKANVFKKQHGGQKAESRTYCYNGTTEPFQKYEWIKWQRRKETH